MHHKPECYIFAYGSLVNNYSTISTLHNLNIIDTTVCAIQRIFHSFDSKTKAIPCRVYGILRSWNYQITNDITSGGLSKGATYLGAISKIEAVCNGVLIPLTFRQLEILDCREKDYIRTKINYDKIQNLTSNKIYKIPIYFYQTKNIQVPNQNNPILQSYLDTCLNGFIEIDRNLKNSNYEMTREFIQSTEGWNKKYWMNDRIYPHRPFVFSPNAYLINKLLVENIDSEIIKNIQ